MPLRPGGRLWRLCRWRRALRHQVLPSASPERVVGRIYANWNEVLGMGGGDVHRAPSTFRRSDRGGERVRGRVQHEQGRVCVPAGGGGVLGAACYRPVRGRGRGERGG